MTLKTQYIVSTLIGLAVLCGVIIVPVSASGNVYYVDPVSGADSNTGNLESPWKTLSESLPKLKPGDTLYLRGGVYFEGNIRVNISGTDSRHITIKNYQEESPVIDGGFKEFRTVPNSDWELHDEANNIYRSVKTYSSAGIIHGYLKTDSGDSHLVPYESYGNLSTSNEVYSETGDIYVGPGVFWNSSDQRIYIRLTPTWQELSMGYNIPQNRDPRQNEINIVPDGVVMYFRGTSSYIDVDGIDVRHRNNALRFSTGSHHINVKNSNILGGRTHIYVSDDVHHLIFDNITIYDSVPPWVSWTDVKKGTKPAHSLQQVAIGLKDGVHDVAIKNSVFNNIFDGVGAGSKIYNVYIRNNEFRGIRDDVIQLGTASYNVEVGNNRMIHVSKGPGRNGSGNSEQPGKKYIHHNIIDLSKRLLHYRAGYPNYAESGDGKIWNRAFGSHSGDKSYIDPWKIYNNTIIAGEMRNIHYNVKGMGYAYLGSYNGIPQEVYNNIFIQTQDHIIERDINVSSGSNILDGNLYYKKVSGSKPIFSNWNDGIRERDFSSLVQFKSDNFFVLTSSQYPPGWENSGIEADPELDGYYRPVPGGPGATGAVDLSSKGWPGSEKGNYRGALSPDSFADTIPPASPVNLKSD